MSLTPKKQKMSKETLYVGAALSCMVVIIVITSITNSGLDPAKIFSKANLSNMIINAAITIFGTVASIPSGSVDTKQHTNADGSSGRYLQEFNDYHTIRSKIEPRRALFGQWHHAQYLNEYREKRINYLLSHGVMQAEDILELSREQIGSLLEPQRFTIRDEEVYFKALSVEQIMACLKVYDGKITVHKLPDFYFLYIDGKGKRSFYDQAYYESRDENYTLISKLVYRVFLGFVITCIFTGLIADLSTLEQITPQFIIGVIFMIVTRVFNAVSSTFWGYLIGQEIVYKQCYYINGKTQFLQSFDNDREFQFKSVRQLAEEDYLNDKKSTEQEVSIDGRHNERLETTAEQS